MNNHVLNKRNNCLNTFRLIAAIQVAYGHIIVHLDIKMPEFVGTILWFFQGVPIFFVISGFLIWESVERSKTYAAYLKKRFYRMYPELWCAIAVEGIVLIVLHGVSDAKDFVLFMLTQATFFQFWTPDSLRGYGCGTPNGALWTIGVLIQFYVIVWFMRKFLHNKKLMCWILVFSASVLLGMIPSFVLGILPVILIKLYGQTVFAYLYLFVAGAFLAEFKNKLLPIVIKYWCVLLCLGAVFYLTGIDIPYTSYNIIKSILTIYGIIGFAYAFPKLNIKTDVSYGLYIYHMTVVNAMITFGLVGKAIYLFVALAISLLFAWISTKTVGLWSQNKKFIV